jgi:hypothetical protein
VLQSGKRVAARRSSSHNARWHIACKAVRGGNTKMRIGETVMSSFAPEFVQFWLARPAAVAVSEAKTDLHRDELDRERAALEELAERVFAARSIV